MFVHALGVPITARLGGAWHKRGSSRCAFSCCIMPKHTSPPSEAAQPGAFVPVTMIHDIDSSISALFVTVEAVRHFMNEIDDGSLEWQLLRQALPDSFHDLLSRLDRAGIVETTSQYPESARVANRVRNQNQQSSAAESHPTSAYGSEAWESMVQLGRRLLMNFLLGKALEENEEHRAALLQLAIDVVPLRRG
ncbi:MAG: hypothetical protein ABI876_00390 [Bacteroidota bacterium]